jgi:hypothetical protein
MHRDPPGRAHPAGCGRRSALVVPVGHQGRTWSYAVYRRPCTPVPALRCSSLRAWPRERAGPPPQPAGLYAFASLVHGVLHGHQDPGRQWERMGWSGRWVAQAAAALLDRGREMGRGGDARDLERAGVVKRRDIIGNQMMYL